MLSDADIQRAISDREISIAPFSEDSLTPNGYDLSVGELKIPSMNLDITNGKIEIPEHTRFLVGTLEKVSLGKRHVAELWLKSRWARRGVMATFGLVDAGFSGILTIGAFATEPVTINVGDKFVQICFFELKTEVEQDYSQRSGNYQNQKNIKI